MDLTVLIPTAHDGEDLASLLPQLKALLDRLGVRHEVLLLAQHVDLTPAVARQFGAQIIEPTAPGYGSALVAGLACATGEFVLTMDADLSHPPAFVEQLWNERHAADITIASRYVAGGGANMGASRYALSRALNVLFSRGLDVPIQDLSSGFRLYRTALLRELRITSRDYDALQQIVVQAFAEGWRVREIPFVY